MKKSLLILTVLFMTGCSIVTPVKRTFPEVPNELMEKCPELEQTGDTQKLSDVLKVVTENYSDYHECRNKVDAWTQWYKTQKQIFESVK